MRRREFITLLGGAAAWPFAARAQQPAMPVIGVVNAVSATEWRPYMAGFHRGLGEVGFVEDRNVAVEYRWAEGQFDRMLALAANLVDRRVAVLLIGGNTTGVREVMAAIRTTPIVFTSATDPVAAGLVASLSRPGGNATGVTVISGELAPKRLALLHELIPTAKKIAMLVNSRNPAIALSDTESSRAAGAHLSLEVIIIDGGSASALEHAFISAINQGAAAFAIGSDAFFNSRREQIATLALRHALPTISPNRLAVAAGQLMSYGTDTVDSYRQAGIYVGRILKGEKPADLPVVQPTKFELVINLKTAKALGLEIPPTLLARADEVIE
jgi:putative tryptophan/tyrosine transport system substrate-binding protein